MSKLSQLLNNEELLTKTVKAETKEEAKDILKEGGLEVNDAELDEIAGGISKTAKFILGALGGATVATVAGVSGYFWCKNKKGLVEIGTQTTPTGIPAGTQTRTQSKTGIQTKDKNINKDLSETPRKSSFSKSSGSELPMEDDSANFYIDPSLFWS